MVLTLQLISQSYEKRNGIIENIEGLETLYDKETCQSSLGPHSRVFSMEHMEGEERMHI